MIYVDFAGVQFIYKFCRYVEQSRERQELLRVLSLKLNIHKIDIKAQLGIRENYQLNVNVKIENNISRIPGPVCEHVSKKERDN